MAKGPADQEEAASQYKKRGNVKSPAAMPSVWTHPPLGALPSRALLLDELLSALFFLITWGAGVVFAAQALAQAVPGKIQIDHLAASSPTATIGCVLASKKPKPRHVFINDMHCCKHDTKGCSVELEGTIIMLIECDTVEEQTSCGCQ